LGYGLIETWTSGTSGVYEKGRMMIKRMSFLKEESLKVSDGDDTLRVARLTNKML
jgi:hypothetical protein